MATKNDDQKDDTMTTAEAGRKGGEKVRDERGPEFYSEIGQKQGKENNPGNFANRDKDEVRKVASEGGKNSHRGDSNTAKETQEDFDQAA